MKKLRDNGRFRNALSVGTRTFVGIIGGYCTMSLIVAGLPVLGNYFFEWQKTSLFIWMMLLSFPIYCAFVMWIFASKKLLTHSLIVFILNLCLYIGIQATQPDIAQHGQPVEDLQ